MMMVKHSLFLKFSDKMICSQHYICTLTFKGLFTNYVISKLTYIVLQIMTQHDAIYLVGSLIMMNDGPTLLSMELALE